MFSEYPIPPADSFSFGKLHAATTQYQLWHTHVTAKPFHILNEGINMAVGAVCSTDAGRPVCETIGTGITSVIDKIPEVVTTNVATVVDWWATETKNALIAHGATPDQTEQYFNDVGVIASSAATALGAGAVHKAGKMVIKTLYRDTVSARIAAQNDNKPQDDNAGAIAASVALPLAGAAVYNGVPTVVKAMQSMAPLKKVRGYLEE